MTEYTWNYRIIKNGSWYSIREVHYDDDTPSFTTEEPDGLMGGSVEELRDQYEQMSEAFEQPILNYEDFKE